MNVTNDKQARVMVLGAGFGSLTFCQTSSRLTVQVT